MEIKKTAMITIIGKPNVGKSTLVNQLVGEKITIVTPKPQTTRNRICGIVNRDDTQYIFMDTPGFHKSRSKLGDYMVRVVQESVADVDLIVLMVDPVPNVGTQEKLLIEDIKKNRVPAILVINKIDTIRQDAILAVIAAYSEIHEFESIIPISAKEGIGIDVLFDELNKFAIESPQLYPDDMFSDQPERQIMSEIIREKMLLALDKEIPHGVAIEISRFKERENGIIDIEATIYCEKSSHKGIIIGKHGAMLKKIGESARKDMEEFLKTKIFLEMWVKVKENWRDNQYLIRNFGYE